MSEQDDRTFLKQFSLVILGLVVFTILMLLLSLSIHNQIELSENPAREQAKEQRIQPVAGVYAGETGRAAAQAAVAAAAPAAAAFDGSLDAELIYQRVCQVCHISGAGGAPLMTASEWADRLPKGDEQLVANAITGIGAMPPRGGRMDLTDEQVEVSVHYMLDMVR